MNPTREEIEAAIRREAVKQGLDPEPLIRQCEAESSFKIDACNGKTGCYGLFQFEARTAKWLKVNREDWRDNVRGGVLYMARLKNQYHGDYAKALAAFNWGSGHLDRLLSSSADELREKWTEMGKPELPTWPGSINEYPDGWRAFLPAETKNYLTKILR